MDGNAVSVDISEGIATITLNRPAKLNALNRQLVDEFLQALGQANEDDAVRALIVTGAGRAFCAGGDVQEYLIGTLEWPIVEKEELFRHFCRAAFDLLRLEKPVIAAINGVAAGGGCSLALACDIRIASESARFGMAFVSRGLSGADMGATYLLPRIVGMGKAYELLYTGDVIDAQEALRIGLVNKIVPPESLLPTARELAARLVTAAPIALRLTKRALSRQPLPDLDAELAMESTYQSLCFHTADHREGVLSFIEKRAAQFQGK